MLLQAAPQMHSEVLERCVVGTLQTWWVNEDFKLPPQVLRRCLLALAQTEVARNADAEEPSSLMKVVADYLAGRPGEGRWPASAPAMQALATACARWGHHCDALPEVAERLLRVLQTKLAAKKRLPPSLLLHCLSSTLPLAQGRTAAQPMISRLLAHSAELRVGQLLALLELCVLAWERPADGEVRGLSELRSVMYRRIREMPLWAVPRALAALLQLV
ncbi:unnamed protein product [Effrenium voratum]|nr:unnamed protein product [Effrenium voratum]